MAKAKQPVEADQFLQVVGRIAADNAAASASIRASGNHDQHSAAIFECLASNRHARPAADPALLKEVEDYLRECSLDAQTLIRYAAQGFLARAAAVDFTERAFQMQEHIVGGLLARQKRKRVESARANGKAGGRKTSNTDEIRESKALWIRTHGSKVGWMESATEQFKLSDRAIRERLSPRKSSQVAPRAAK